MRKLEQIDRRLKCGEEDQEELKREVRYNKNENLDNYFTMARTTEEKRQQMAEREETTDKERWKSIKKDMEEMKKRYEILKDKVWRRD